MARNHIPAVASLVILTSFVAIPLLKSGEQNERPAERDKLAFTGSFLSEITKADNFAAVTKERYLMAPDTEMRCAFPLNWHEVHGPRYCEVYITKDSLPMIQKGIDDYPIGTIIVKWKFDKKEGGSRELATVMRKMPPGYSVQHGDWEFAVVNANATQVLARGRIDSCMNCHDNYKTTGYVTREYLERSREPNDEPKISIDPSLKD